jgi:PKHD-type hydroxylase
MIKNHTIYGITWEPVLNANEIEKVHELAALFKSGRGGILNQDIKLESVRRSDVTWLEYNDHTRWLYKKITDAALKINKDIYEFDLDGFQTLQYTVYHDYEQGNYDWHIDTTWVANKKYIRKLSISILLSDTSSFKGGAFLFSPDGGNPVEIEQEKGRMIVFPSWVPHSITPVLRGTRISLVMWLHGKRFK